MFKKIAANWFDLFSHCRNCICGPEFGLLGNLGFRSWHIWIIGWYFGGRGSDRSYVRWVQFGHHIGRISFSDGKLHWSFMGMDTATRFTMDWVSSTCWQYWSVLDDKPWWVSKHLGAARKSIDLSGQVAAERKRKQKRKRHFAKANFRTNLFQAREFDADSNGIINEDGPDGSN